MDTREEALRCSSCDRCRKNINRKTVRTIGDLITTKNVRKMGLRVASGSHLGHILNFNFSLFLLLCPGLS